MTVRIGVLGCGKIANKHFSAYHAIEDVDIVASDIDDSKAEQVRRKGFEWDPDPGRLIERTDVEAIDVCTPVTTHADLIIDALDAGKDVFCEKPLATSSEEVEAIYEQTQSSEGALMVGYLYRYHPAFQFAIDALRDGVIGEPYYAIFRVGGRGNASPWKHKADEHGGAANEMLVHLLDLVSWYFGDFDLVENLHTDTLLPERIIHGESVEATAEDIMLLRLQTETEVDVLCQSDLFTPSYMNYVEIQGTNGSLWTTILDYFPSFVYCKEPRGIFDRGHNFKEFDRVDLFEKELSHFVEVVRDGSEPRWDSLKDSLRIRRVIDEAKS